jgi:DNA-binding response OmpR family regulator
MSTSAPNAHKKPQILVVDDDRDFLALINKVLTKLGFAVTLSSTADEFLRKFKAAPPDACLVDLKLGSAMVGFQLLEAVRVTHQSEIPLFVASAESDAKIIAHAMEQGASDYIVKPIDEQVLASILSPYFTTDAIAGARHKYETVPADRAQAVLTLDFDLRAVDEHGLTMASQSLITKGIPVEVRSPLLAQITGMSDSVRATVMDTWADTERQTYVAYAQFDETDRELLTAVRRWLVAQVP